MHAHVALLDYYDICCRIKDPSELCEVLWTWHGIDVVSISGCKGRITGIVVRSEEEAVSSSSSSASSSPSDVAAFSAARQ